jgi:uncharacterized protein (DUF2141 family)
MKNITLLALLSFVTLCIVSFTYENTYSLTIAVKNLRNSKGVLQVALYNKDKTIPDDDFEKYFKMEKGEINHNASSITFKNLPAGKYAVNILHDENSNGKMDKGFIFPIEGVGFSNFQSVGLTNLPSFSKASFDLNEDKAIVVKAIYF